MDRAYPARMMSAPELQHAFTVKGVAHCFHISFATTDRVWVSDHNRDLILTDKTGGTIQRVGDLKINPISAGLHTVNNEGALFYVNMDFTIIKLSANMKSTTYFSKNLEPQCVVIGIYYSFTTDELILGMLRPDKETCHVARYNMTGQLTRTIKHDNTGRNLYIGPCFITENNNEDVVVSDCDRAVVVTDREGRYRFSYTGHPSGTVIYPRGICTDSLSHILVCDIFTETVHMINKDGQFLMYLLKQSQGIIKPSSLYFDTRSYCLWVGSSENNNVCIYKYLTRKNDITGKIHKGRGLVIIFFNVD